MSNDNGNNAAKALADSLNGLLADSFALYFKTKNFHWHVAGPNFRDYHLLLDEHAAEIIGITDVIAERVRKIGYRTLTSIGSVAAKQSVSDNDSEDIDAKVMLEELRNDNMAFVKALKDTKELAEAAGDNATDGLIDDWTDQAEQRAWFLRETLK
ncbi:DNA starvation/stationary phase protection protein [Sphingorhabdus sp. Alg239-R122]|uniref:Dps family protein n=1 Tax=Sphingorhabdus sp. Alg239-R122 TaxID=2305989 RepID=UPI0013DD11F9|nr:DNA starvation/stationary phase protection protein [Sphingorhabdus sp. Alg239-R122]